MDEINKLEYPMLAARMDTRFFKDLTGGTAMSVNGSPMSRGVWNMIISKRDLSLWVRGMKPNRHWKVSDVKAYFGIKGRGQKLLDQFLALTAEVDQLHAVNQPGGE